jgi:beta-glucosidase
MPPRDTTSSQRYTPLHESIPEELNDNGQASDTDSLPLSDPSDAEDESEIKLRRVDRNGARRGDHADAYVPVVRKSGDVEAYLDSITEAEQELLSANRQYDIVDDDEDNDSDGYGMGVKKGSKQGLLHGTRGQRGGWRTVYYSKYWWRILIGVGLALVLLVWVFLSLAWSKETEDESDFVCCFYNPYWRG